MNTTQLSVLWLIGWYLPALALGAGAALGWGQEWGHHHLASALQGIALTHPLGFDAFGRDLLTTTWRASALSSTFAAIATVFSIFSGALVGTALAIARPTVRFLGLRTLETLLAFPSLLFSLAWSAVRGPGWDTLAFSLMLAVLPSLIRLVYVRAQELLAQDFVLAARSLGASPLRIAWKHLLPSIFSLCRVKAPNLFAGALMAEATLSFLGIGAPIGRDSWGTLLAQGKDYLIEAPHLAIGSGLPLVLTVMSLQGVLKGRSSLLPKKSQETSDRLR